MFQLELCNSNITHLYHQSFSLNINVLIHSSTCNPSERSTFYNMITVNHSTKTVLPVYTHWLTVCYNPHFSLSYNKFSIWAKNYFTFDIPCRVCKCCLLFVCKMPSAAIPFKIWSCTTAQYCLFPSVNPHQSLVFLMTTLLQSL